MSASSASATAATAESEQRHAPPTPVPPLSRCADPPLGCSASDYMALLADASGLCSVDEARAKLYDCARHGKVNACRAILDI
jgi:hypothetical protein